MNRYLHHVIYAVVIIVLVILLSTAVAVILRYGRNQRHGRNWQQHFNNYFQLKLLMSFLENSFTLTLRLGCKTLKYHLIGWGLNSPIISMINYTIQCFIHRRYKEKRTSVSLSPSGAKMELQKGDAAVTEQQPWSAGQLRLLLHAYTIQHQ